MQTVSRRYRQGLGGWWWGAFVSVPLILAAIGTNTSTAAPDTASSTRQPILGLSTPADAVWISLQRSGQTVSITGSFPDETSRQAAMAAVQIGLGPEITINDLSTVTPGSTGISPQTAQALGTALAVAPDLRISFDGLTATYAGTAPTKQAEQAVLAAGSTAYPGASVLNHLNVTAITDCRTLPDRLASTVGSGQIRFSYGSSDLSKAGEQAIGTAATILRACPEIRVTVFGYADKSGSTESNLAISKDRAEVVASRLRKQGVTNPIRWQGRGSNNPIAPNSSNPGRIANRRATIVAEK